MLKGTNHDRTNYTHFSILFARCSTAGAGRMLGVLMGRSRPACANRRGGAGRPAQEAAHLPSVGRDGGRGRRGPKGVVHGAATASQVRPSVGGRGGGGWIRKAGHCRARGESKAKTCRSTHTLPGARGLKVAAGQGSRAKGQFQRGWAS